MVKFTSRLGKREKLLAAIGLILHLVVLPQLLTRLAYNEVLPEETANFLLYAVMAVYVLVCMRGFLRRDFDALADRPLGVIIEAAGSYLAYVFFTTTAAYLLLPADMPANPNNQAIMDMAMVQSGTISAMAIFLAPIVEEVLFRGFIFSSLRRYSRFWAYTASVLVFALYHIFAYALADWHNLIYLVQYIPASILLCRCYERRNTIWCPIALHMLINFMSMKALEMLR